MCCSLVVNYFSFSLYFFDRFLYLKLNFSKCEKCGWCYADFYILVIHYDVFAEVFDM
jgi:hypothetical protein